MTSTMLDDLQYKYNIISNPVGSTDKNSPTTYVLDISSWTGTGYLGFGIYNMVGSSIYNKNFYIVDAKLLYN